MVDKARRIFGRKAVAKRGRFGHQIVVVFLPERLQVQYLADVSAPRGGKADAGAAFSCGHRLPVSSPTPCLEGGICSACPRKPLDQPLARFAYVGELARQYVAREEISGQAKPLGNLLPSRRCEIGRASGRERGCKYV